MRAKLWRAVVWVLKQVPGVVSTSYGLLVHIATATTLPGDLRQFRDDAQRLLGRIGGPAVSWSPLVIIGVGMLLVVAANLPPRFWAWMFRRGCSVDEEAAKPPTREREAVRETPAAPVPATPAAPRLAIEFNHQAHVTRQPNGSVTVRMSVRNFGSVPVTGLVVRIRSLVPESSAKKLSPYTSQFNDLPLKIVRPETAASINPGDGIEVMVASIDPATPEWLRFHSREGDYQTPRGKIWMTLVASAENAQPDQQVFLLTATKANLAISQLIDPP